VLQLAAVAAVLGWAAVFGAAVFGVAVLPVFGVVVARAVVFVLRLVVLAVELEFVAATLRVERGM
jgi:hypothetical protein